MVETLEVPEGSYGFWKILTGIKGGVVMYPQIGAYGTWPTVDDGAVSGKILYHLGENRFTVETQRGMIDVTLRSPYRENQRKASVQKEPHEGDIQWEPRYPNDTRPNKPMKVFRGGQWVPYKP